ncbi:MAG: aldo/keto reductase [Frondihabitans sp.]|nr:aldo/keto reductase [Frondihabitans sp.]
MPGLYGYDVDSERAIDTVRHALDSSIRFMDTSNGYADSETRIGCALRLHGGLPKDYVLATKVDPALGSTDFSGRRVRESFEESLGRLGVDHLQLLHLHDPERVPFEEAMAAGGPVQELIALRDEGLVGHLGVAGGNIEAMMAYVETDVFDVVLTHSRYTLLDRSAGPLLDLAREHHLGTLNAAPFAGGLVARGPGKQPGYAYSAQDSFINHTVSRMIRVSEHYDVPLAAAALQLSLQEARIDSTVVGVSTPARIDETLQLMSIEIPQGMWNDLNDLLPPTDRWLN